MSEITITRVEQDGAVHGAYCHHFPRFHALGVIELHPEHATAATLSGGTLRFEVGTSHIEAKLDPENPEVLLFSNRRADAVAKSVLPMTRIEAPQCTAQYIGHVITEISGTEQSLAEHMPEQPDHALIGHWSGRDPETDLIVELSIFHIEANSARGVFCNAWTVNAAYFYALDPTHGFLAPVTADTLRFDVNAIGFTFQLETGTLRMTRETRGNTKTLTLKTTDAPTCARRFIPSPHPKA